MTFRAGNKSGRSRTDFPAGQVIIPHRRRAQGISVGIRDFWAPVWYENLSGVVSCPENSNINADGLDSVVVGSRDQ